MAQKKRLDQALIQEWIGKVRHIKFVLDQTTRYNRGSVSCTMFEQGKEMLYMTPTDYKSPADAATIRVSRPND